MLERIEKTTLVLVLASFFLASLFLPGTKVLGVFNSIDGSLYPVRFMDFLAALAFVWGMAYRLIPESLSQGRIGSFFLQTVGLFAVVCAVEWLVDKAVIQLFNLPTGPDEYSVYLPDLYHAREIHSSILPGNLILLGIGFFYGLSRDWIRTFRQRQEVQKFLLQTELDFLRSQINPHFLFNTLNSIYAMTRRSHDSQSGEAILQLAGIMRYMLHECSDPVVPLVREAEHIDQYLKLVRLRFAEDDAIDLALNVKISQPETVIAPLLLIPLVENAVKHGLSRQGAGYVHVEIEAENGAISCRVVNSLQREESPLERHSGIGMDNVTRRLEVLYGERASLRVVREENRYLTTLTIARDE